MFGGVELDFDDDLAQEQTSRKEKRKEKVDKPRDKDRRESESKERRKHRDPNESREDKERRRSERRKRREEEGQETSRSHKSKARDQTTPPDAELEIAVVAPNIYDAEMDLLKKAGMGKNRNPTAEPIPIAPVALKEVSSRKSVTADGSSNRGSEPSRQKSDVSKGSARPSQIAPKSGRADPEPKSPTRVPELRNIPGESSSSKVAIFSLFESHLAAGI
eukprot:c17587_g1_i4.p1 GENE.c17587_g1_i4~~c17587_g1_i4.p1  ORF type:complete len:239 (-),score=39.91 c17587_g1_i4:418-1074(-)